jgi:hypothetical protein
MHAEDTNDLRINDGLQLRHFLLGPKFSWNHCAERASHFDLARSATNETMENRKTQNPAIKSSEYSRFKGMHSMPIGRLDQKIFTTALVFSANTSTPAGAGSKRTTGKIMGLTKQRKTSARQAWPPPLRRGVIRRSRPAANDPETPVSQPWS